MVAIAEIFRIHGPDYRAQFGDRRLPAHLRAMPDIEQCRTAALGGPLYYGDKCRDDHYRDHACTNRPCPKCQNGPAQAWLENQKSLLLPVTHFMVTFTLPAARRAVARSHQKTIDNILFRSSSEALQELALDPRCIGGRVAMVGGLHPGTRDLLSHPHLHYIVAGGGLSGDGNWLPSREAFLVHVKPLSVIFQAKFRDQLKKTDLFAQVDEQGWKKDWVVHCQPVGSGEHAFRYLAPYIFRVAISTKSILKLEDGQVTFQDKESATDQTPFCPLTAEEFIRRFLQHVLPDRFIKVRYYGLLSPSTRHLRNRTRQLLAARAIATKTTGKHPCVKQPIDAPRCPHCGSILILVQTLRPNTRSPP